MNFLVWAAIVYTQSSHGKFVTILMFVVQFILIISSKMSISIKGVIEIVHFSSWISCKHFTCVMALPDFISQQCSFMAVRWNLGMVRNEVVVAATGYYYSSEFACAIRPRAVQSKKVLLEKSHAKWFCTKIGQICYYPKKLGLNRLH